LADLESDAGLKHGSHFLNSSAADVHITVVALLSKYISFLSHDIGVNCGTLGDFFLGLPGLLCFKHLGDLELKREFFGIYSLYNAFYNIFYLIFFVMCATKK
jgi:hypothetical protein